MKTPPIFAALISCLLAGPTAADTVTYTGSTSTMVTRSTMPLANGGSVVMATNAGVAALSTTPPTLLEMSCMGLGLVETKRDHGTDFYCTFKASEEDRFDLKGADGPGGGQATVIGGSGKWKNASGSATFKRVSGGESASVATFELTLTTP